MWEKNHWFDWHSYNSGFYCILAFSSTVGVITFSLITLKVLLYLRGTPAILYCTTISLGHLQATYLKKNDLNWYSTGWDILFFKKKRKEMTLMTSSRSFLPVFTGGAVLLMTSKLNFGGAPLYVFLTFQWLYRCQSCWKNGHHLWGVLGA